MCVSASTTKFLHPARYRANSRVVLNEPSAMRSSPRAQAIAPKILAAPSNAKSAVADSRLSANLGVMASVAPFTNHPPFPTSPIPSRTTFSRMVSSSPSSPSSPPSLVALLSLEMVGPSAPWTIPWRLITNIPWSSLAANLFSSPSDLTGGTARHSFLLLLDVPATPHSCILRPIPEGGTFHVRLPPRHFSRSKQTTRHPLVRRSLEPRQPRHHRATLRSRWRNLRWRQNHSRPRRIRKILRPSARGFLQFQNFSSFSIGRGRSGLCPLVLRM